MNNFTFKGIIVLICASFLLSFNSTSEIKITPDPRIAEAFGQTYVDNLMKSNPDLINYYNFYLEKSWKLVDLPANKTKKLTDLKLKPEHKNTKSSNFNILLYDVSRYFEKNNYYLYKGKVLVLISEKEFMGLYNEYRNAQNK